MSQDDLRQAFGTPATQLGDILPKRAPSPPAPEPESAEPPPAAAPEPAPAAASPAPSSAPPAPADTEPTSQVSVYLTADALAAVRRAKGRRGDRTNADVALDSIDATIDRLPGLLAARHTTDRPGSLFPPRRRPQRTSRQGDPPRVLWSMKATPGELVVLDRLVDQVGAGSRSELIATAIEAHLTRTRRRRQA